MRELSVVLSLLLIVMAGAIVVVLVSRPAPGPTASPTTVAGSPTASPSRSPALSPTQATTSPTAGGSPTDSPPPTSSPTLGPATQQRAITFVDMGLDTTDTGGEEPVARVFTFVADGSGRIEATVSDVTFGRVSMCLWQGDATIRTDEECRLARQGTLRRDIDDGGPVSYSVSLIGSQAGASPSATLRIRWPTTDARMQIAGFRFQGEEIENYNGFTAEVELEFAGSIDVAATFDDGVGGVYPYRLIIEEIGGGPAQAFFAEGEGSEMQASTEGDAGRSYRITLANRLTVVDQRVLVTAELNWP
jgi:hypothetical protein